MVPRSCEGVGRHLMNFAALPVCRLASNAPRVSGSLRSFLVRFGLRRGAGREFGRMGPLQEGGRVAFGDPGGLCWQFGNPATWQFGSLAVWQQESCSPTDLASPPA